MNMFARFDENPAITLQDIKERKRYGQTHARMDGRTDGHENSIPTTNKGARAIRRIFSLVDMITKPKFSIFPNIFKIGLFR